MNLIQCPERLKARTKQIGIFLAGGITSCPLWQDVAVELFKDEDLLLLNPRRKVWSESITTFEQVKWEFDHLELADMVMFWFPHETLCPITLLELGKLLVTNRRIVIGIHPDYQRKADIEIQYHLARPYEKTPICYSLEETVQEAIKIAKGYT